jgi:hypothetical protein
LANQTPIESQSQITVEGNASNNMGFLGLTKKLLEIYRLPLGPALQSIGLVSLTSSYKSLGQGAAKTKNKIGGRRILSNQSGRGWLFSSHKH